MLRQIQPRNARAKRALEKRAPKAVENPRTSLFLRGTSASQVVQDAMGDLYAMRQHLSKRFTKKNAIHPFEDASSLEFFSLKNDASFLVFGSSSKKRPHTITLVRTFDAKVLDMLELNLDAESFRRINQFSGKKPAVGLRPMLVFAGTAWESPVSNEYTMARSMLTTFFTGDTTSDKVDVEGLTHVIVFTAEGAVGSGVEDAAKPAIHLRQYLLQTKRSGGRLPRVELEEVGPRMTLRPGRMREPEEAMLKEAMRQPKTGEERTKKNITTDIMGDKLGRIHLDKTDFTGFQSRKMKGLKRGRKDEDDTDETEDLVSDDEPKKRRK
ncbi:Ribosome biogenesis protein RPF2 [Pleurostoma richardsiae]|uniref:Ribosome production factor 2 homolog n=1 Tax=Pleurostoma richardsiae TaxID=41990 RepID=A0AA38R4H6_9PEZI|nr:Ribosome biogenesis protein RPF2 [Pleurostoma richardsiae]